MKLAPSPEFNQGWKHPQARINEPGKISKPFLLRTLSQKYPELVQIVSSKIAQFETQVVETRHQYGIVSKRKTMPAQCLTDAAASS
jgi:hypothetical protein